MTPIDLSLLPVQPKEKPVGADQAQEDKGDSISIDMSRLPVQPEVPKGKQTMEDLTWAEAWMMDFTTPKPTMLLKGLGEFYRAGKRLPHFLGTTLDELRKKGIKPTAKDIAISSFFPAYMPFKYRKEVGSAMKEGFWEAYGKVEGAEGVAAFETLDLTDSLPPLSAVVTL